METETNIFDLLQDHRIVIPCIQRGYVHGENTPKAKEVLEHFIKEFIALFRCREKPGRGKFRLDFTYGMKDGVSTIPLDGQQRLTTLWLIAVSLCHMHCPDDQKRRVLSELGKFSYDGRPDATAFCHAITRSTETYLGVLKYFDDEESETSAKLDPTVRAMRETLRTVESEISRMDKGRINWDDCVDALKRVVFSFVEINELKCTAKDLYVKINARGKTLTQWENFKGKFSEALTEGKGVFDEQIEKLSNSYYVWSKTTKGYGENPDVDELPDNAFFSLFGRITDYEIRSQSAEEQEPVAIGQNLMKLAERTKSFVDLPYVPAEEFSFNRTANKIAQPVLRLLKWCIDNSKAPFPYWNSSGKNIGKTLFFPANQNDLDFALFLYEYFKKYSIEVCSLSDDEYRPLRLVANILENVSRDQRQNGCSPVAQFNRVRILTRYIEASPELYVDFGGKLDDVSPLQCFEECAKAKVYQNHPGIIAPLKRCEELMNGRVRIALFDRDESSNGALKWRYKELSSKAERRLQVLNAKNEEWLGSTEDGERRTVMLKEVISAEPWGIIDEVVLSTKNDSLRKILSTRNEVHLQGTYIDGDVGLCASNADPKNWSALLPWRRDWRQNVFIVRKWQEKIVKRHTGTGTYYLYDHATITNAMPVSDWRFDIGDAVANGALAELGEVDSVRSNDGGTRSFQCRMVKSPDERMNIYFWKEAIEVRWFNYVGQNEKSGWIYIKKSVIDIGIVVSKIKDMIQTMRKVQVNDVQPEYFSDNIE